jgi:hypothetical protein
MVVGARALQMRPAPPAPVENAQPEPNGPMLNVFSSSLEAEDRRFREREAVRLRNELAPQELSPETRGRRRRREPTEEDYLNLEYGEEELQMELSI